MFEGCSYLLTEMSFEIHPFEISRLEEINPALDLNLFVIFFFVIIIIKFIFILKKIYIYKIKLQNTTKILLHI